MTLKINRGVRSDSPNCYYHLVLKPFYVTVLLCWIHIIKVRLTLFLHMCWSFFSCSEHVIVVTVKQIKVSKEPIDSPLLCHQAQPLSSSKRPTSYNSKSISEIFTIIIRARHKDALYAVTSTFVMTILYETVIKACRTFIISYNNENQKLPKLYIKDCGPRCKYYWSMLMKSCQVFWKATECFEGAIWAWVDWSEAH